MKKNVCVSVYPKHHDVDLALTRLKNTGINLLQVSVIGHGSQEAHFPIGLYYINNQLQFLDKKSAFWDGLSGLLSGVALFWIPGFGSLIAAGSVISLLVTDLEAYQLGHGFSELGAALFEMGIPRSSISEYEKAVTAGQLILIVHDEWELVEKACKILHAKNQQVTVHYA